MLTFAGTSQGAVKAGRYTIVPSGLSSDNYSISYSGGQLEITTRTLAASLGGIVEKNYDGTAEALLSASNFLLEGVISGDRVQLTNPGSGKYADALPGSGKDVTAEGLGLTGPDAVNYTLAATSVSGAVGRINPVADLAVELRSNHNRPNTGSAVTFTVTVTNNGPNEATEVSVGDQLKKTGFDFLNAAGGKYDHASGLWKVGS
ncbi:MAG TPA: YDG domain-containing protein, partial [Sphingobacteriaceae bacterium]